MKLIQKGLKSLSTSKLLKAFLLGLIALNSILWISYLQKRNQETHWKRNIWADASGYFVYLPSTFIYHFNTESYNKEFGNRIDENGEIPEVGNGFRIKDGKITTKYFYGVALLQSPVFLIIHMGYLISENAGDGFNGLYEHTTIISSVLYFLLSLIILYQLLRKKVSESIALTAIFFTIFATNVIYYFGAYPGYTHPYLFFLASAFLYVSNKYSQNQDIKNAILLYAIGGLIVVTRPINAIVLITFFIDNDIKKLTKLISPKKLILGSIVAAIIILPQLIYYKYISGYWFHYSYGDETFINLLNPSLINFLFSTNNGLFTYNPIWFIFLFASVYLMFTKHQRLALITIILFITSAYLCSSWHIWNFGAGYGSRNFVDYAPIFTLPFALILDHLRTRWKLFTIIAVSILFCYINFKFMYRYDKCYSGKGNWDIEYIKSFF